MLKFYRWHELFGLSHTCIKTLKFLVAAFLHVPGAQDNSDFKNEKVGCIIPKSLSANLRKLLQIYLVLCDDDDCYVEGVGVPTAGAT